MAKKSCLNQNLKYISESYQSDAIWRNFTESEIREKSKQIRKLSVDRWKVIEEAEIANGGRGCHHWIGSLAFD